MPLKIVDESTLHQKVVHLLQQGMRTSTYKLATVYALIDLCVAQQMSPSSMLDVPLDYLAQRVFEIYWPQAEPFGEIRLRQSTQSTSRIFDSIDAVRSASGTHPEDTLAEAIRLAPVVYRRAIDNVVLVLAQQPLPRLQRVPGAARSLNVLFDDSFLHDNTTRNDLAKHNNAIKLYAGVAAGLAKLQPRLHPLIRSIWADDVIRLNKLPAEQREEVSEHLFGTRELLKPPTERPGNTESLATQAVSAPNEPKQPPADEPVLTAIPETNNSSEPVGPVLDEIAALCEIQENGCWVAPSNSPVRCRPEGDARRSMDLQKNPLHRWAWLVHSRLADRNIPPYLIQVRRRCKEKTCCNPAHLFPAAPGGAELTQQQVDALLERSFVTNAPSQPIQNAGRTISLPQTVLTEDLSDLAALCTISTTECWISPTTQTLPCRASGDLRAFGDLPRLSTHRWAWMVANSRARNPLPGDLFQVWKRCTNYRCCNPAHLYLTGPDGKECSSEEAESQLQEIGSTSFALGPTGASTPRAAPGGRHRAVEASTDAAEATETAECTSLADRMNELIAARAELGVDADAQIATSLQQDGLAVSASVITRLRSGTGPVPSTSTIEAIAYYFNVDTDYFSTDAHTSATPDRPNVSSGPSPEEHTRTDTKEPLKETTKQIDRARLGELIGALSESIIECLTDNRPDTERARRLAGWIVELSPSIESTSDAASVEMNLVEQILDEARSHLRDRRAPTSAIPEQLGSLDGTPRIRTPVQSAASRSASPQQISGDWTRESFIDAVRVPSDRTFLLRIFELLDENFALPPLGSHTPLFYGKRPNGAVFVYPFGLRHPPFHFGINSDGRLTIRGCWRGFPKVTSHYGFGELARLLGQDELGPSQNVPVYGLVADEVWKVGVRVARAVNR